MLEKNPKSQSGEPQNISHIYIGNNLPTQIQPGSFLMMFPWFQGEDTAAQSETNCNNRGLQRCGWVEVVERTQRKELRHCVCSHEHLYFTQWFEY